MIKSNEYFPARGSVPFGDHLSLLFFHPRSDNRDYPIHGPNVIRMAMALLNNRLDAEGLLVGSDDEQNYTRNLFFNSHAEIRAAIELADFNPGRIRQTEDFMRLAALYHDIGKTIRRANHLQIGANLLRNFDQDQSAELVNALQYAGEPDDNPSKYNRFSLLCSIIQHHDKFGVVSTGEGALPIFSDILYFTSDERGIPGILKNVTSVMLQNLADIAAVRPATAPREDAERAEKIAGEVWNGREQGSSASDETAVLRNYCISTP